METFSQKTTQLLHRAGWTENRSVDISEYRRILTQHGYIINKYILDFLEKFGGLCVYHPHFRVPEKEDFFCLDPIIAVKYTTVEQVAKYEKKIGKKLCVIGEASYGYLILMMSEDGQVFASYDDYFAFVGDSGFGAIETFCSGRELQQISD